ncbi:MAG: InlB B-repeat-containing protein, partial [Alphaproteobacteria bacterium]|nr:InlB B-repeat-containing protein [Alphaproteobacteria bacterium]
MSCHRVAAFVRGLSLALLCCLAAATSSYSAPSLISRFGTTGAETAITAMTRDANGNLYVAGTFGGSTLLVGNLILSRSQAPRDGFVAKYGPGGDAVWVQSFGSTSNTLDLTISAIAVDNAGKIYLAGSFGGNFTDVSVDAQNDNYGFVLGTTAGNISIDWSYVARGTGVELLDVAVDPQRNSVFVAGKFSFGNLNTPTVPLTGNSDGLIMRLNSGTGALLWNKTVAGAGSSVSLNGIALDKNRRSIYVAGGFGGAGLTSPVLALGGDNDAAIFRVDYDGLLVQAVQSFSGPGANITTRRLVIDDDAANLYLVGNFGGSITTPSAAALTMAGGEVAGFAIGLAADGTIAWANRFGGNATDMSLSSAVAAGSRLYVAGSFDGGNIDTPADAAMTRIGTRDGFVIVLGQNGQVAAAGNYGGADAELTIKGAALNDQGGIFLGGELSGASLATPSASLIGDRSAVILADAPSPPPPRLTIASPSNGTVRDGGGDLVCGTSCSASYTAGTAVALTATPATGYVFAGW